MKQLLLVVGILCLALFVASEARAQMTIDSGFNLATEIKPSSYPDWPDGMGAEKVLSGFDINHNGKKEFVAMGDPAWVSGDTTRPYIFWFEAAGDNTYNLLWTGHVPGTNTGAFGYADFTVADIDNDGKMEITVVVPRNTTDREEAILFIYEFEGGAFPTEPTASFAMGLRTGMQYRASRLEVADVDGDGENEVVIVSRRDDFGGANGSANGRTLLVEHFFGGDINNGTFGYFEPEFIDSSATLKGGGVYDMGIVDFDGDGKKEIWVATWDLLSLAIYEGTGKDTYALRADINQARPDNDVGVRNSMRWYDANGDGKLEYYFAGITDVTNPGNLFMAPSTNDVSTLTTGSIVTLTPDREPIDAWTYEGADIGDPNGDGKMDYFVCGSGIQREIWWLHYKGGNPADSSNYFMTTLLKDTAAATIDYSFHTINIGNDIDGDGKKEIFIPNRYTRSTTATDAAIIVLESKTTSTDVTQTGGLLPEQFSLSQNYPNPFNPATMIEFQVPARGFVTLSVHDLLGREVATLMNQELTAGSYRVAFDAHRVPSGTYFYTLKSGNFQQTRKMILVK